MRKSPAPIFPSYDLVILAESKIGPEKKRIIREFVGKGGNLIAFRPDPELAELFGLKPSGDTLSEGYIRVDSSSEPGKGIVSHALQFHGTADLCALDEGEEIASLYPDKQAAKGYPAVVSHQLQKRPGHCLSLQPAQKRCIYPAGKPRTGRPRDGRDTRTPEPGPVYRGVGRYLQQYDQPGGSADGALVELHRVLNKDSGPLPRFWYFPDTLRCLATLTNDGEYRTEADFESQFRDVDSMGAKMSLYILETDKVSKQWADKWTARGFEISAHPDDTGEAGHPGWNTMDRVLKNKKQEIESKFGVQVRTVVNHWFVWCGNRFHRRAGFRGPGHAGREKRDRTGPQLSAV